MPRFFRFAAAALLVAGGAIHLSLYLDGYRSIPRIGVVFVANVVVAAVLAVALVARPLRISAVAALGFSAATMVAFLLSRTTGLLGFMEAGWDTKAASAFAVEALTVAVLGIWFSTTTAPRPQPLVVPTRKPPAPGW
jgi:hypothetical protein